MSVRLSNYIHHSMVGVGIPPQDTLKDAQRQAWYQRRLSRSVQTSRLPRLTDEKQGKKNHARSNSNMLAPADGACTSLPSQVLAHNHCLQLFQDVPVTMGESFQQHTAQPKRRRHSDHIILAFLTTVFTQAFLPRHRLLHRFIFLFTGHKRRKRRPCLQASRTSARPSNKVPLAA